MDSFHPQGAGLLCGAQIRYIIGSTRGSLEQQVFPAPPIGSGTGTGGLAWMTRPGSTTSLSDRRLHRRMLTLCRDCYAHPWALLPSACGSEAATKRAYRFFSNQRDMASILQGRHIYRLRCFIVPLRLPRDKCC